MNRQDLVTTIEIRDRNGRVVGSKEVVRYAGLLNRAHEEGLKRIETKIVQVPTEGNGMTAVAHATVETTKGVFTGTGDASPENANARVGRFLTALAETRAKARALRDAVNIGVVSLEEILGEENGERVLETGAEASGAPAADRGVTRPFPKKAEAGRPQPNGAPMTEAQRRFLFRLLADQGIRSDAAHDYLKEAFGTDSLQAVTKEQASALIDELLGSGGGGKSA